MEAVPSGRETVVSTLNATRSRKLSFDPTGQTKFLHLMNMMHKRPRPLKDQHTVVIGNGTDVKKKEDYLSLLLILGSSISTVSTLKDATNVVNRCQRDKLNVPLEAG